MGLQSFPIFAPKNGLRTNVKPVFLPDDAWAQLFNGYVWRERTLKREGLKLLGRLTRVLTSQSLGNTTAGPTTTIANIFSTLGIPELHPELQTGTLVITVGGTDTATFTDNGNGTFTVTGKGSSTGSFVNYETGHVVLQFSPNANGGQPITANLSYFPSLPVMGIVERDLSIINQVQTIWFDQTYAYIWNGTGFNEFIPGTTWASSNSDFFWAFNYRGSADNVRLLFETNFVNTAANPMRFTDGITWTTFQPIIADNPPSAAQSLLYSAKILIAYYGRLLALNTWEGTTAGGNIAAVNFYNRCRFSAYSADPTAANAWRSDQFGQGGFIDAPVNEQIIGATFIRNTLVVTFENSTWQLRYVGEYGLPFTWERISSDFGSESTFSSVLFDNYMLAIGDKAIIASNANGSNRIDLDIPDTVFGFQNQNNGKQRVYGIRNFQKEIVYWNYVDSNFGPTPVALSSLIFPTNVLLYNYRNNTWAIFRDNVTALGNFQNSGNILWDSLTVTWDSFTVTWDNIQSQALFPSIVSGNQQGFVHLYQEDSGVGTTTPIQEEPSETISAVNLGVTPIQLTIYNHNLANDEIVFIMGLQFLDASLFTPISTSLNNAFYQVQVVDANTISLFQWNFSTLQYDNNFTFTPSPSNYLYVGGGLLTLVPKLSIISKDINLFQANSLQTKLSRLDLLMQPSSASQVAINLLKNATPAPLTTDPDIDFDPVWSGVMSTVLSPSFYASDDSDYSWFRHYVTLAAQYFSINITYDDNMMNTQSTHYDPFTLYAINAWCRPGGKNVF